MVNHMVIYTCSKENGRKGGNHMEDIKMTDTEFKTFIELIITIIEQSKTKEEALEKLKNLTVIKK